MSIPKLVDVPFVDGPRKVAEYLAVLFKQYDIPTYRLTYEKAVVRVNKTMERRYIWGRIDDIRTEHIKKYST